MICFNLYKINLQVWIHSFLETNNFLGTGISVLCVIRAYILLSMVQFIYSKLDPLSSGGSRHVIGTFKSFLRGRYGLHFTGDITDPQKV